jgi:flavin reductase (DIM6/NTAB) family NADH-FMN oxidoreductase RutF
MKKWQKADYDLTEVRRILEPGPVVLVSSQHHGQRNIMTMGWHMMLGFSPALFACYIWPGNHSHEIIRKSEECVINVPTRAMLDQVVGIGNTSGKDFDKFDHFGLTAELAEHVHAPLIAEAYANFECRLHDASNVGRYDLFVWEVVKAHVAVEPAHPETVHYLGRGQFMVAGKIVNCQRRFKPQNL